ncbi:MAG: hypothetical protein EOP06_29970, partial [Proteobacteria bacterium]
MSETGRAQNSDWETLVQYRRNGINEVSIQGGVAWVTGDDVIHQIGSQDLIYGRSLTKPFQMKGLTKDLDRELSLDAKALSVASHGSEEIHLQTLNTILDPARLKLLVTPPSMPLGAGVFAKKPSPLFHPCSGKHAAILLTCELKGWPTRGYTEPTHPYFQAYVTELRKVLGASWEPKAMAKDGCGLPTFSMTLVELATLFSSLARTKDDDWIFRAMTERPEIVGGTGRLDTAIMKACGGKVLAKEGADGLLGLSILHEDYPHGLGIVIKIAHGWDPKATWFIASVILRTLGFNFGNPPALDRQKAFVSERVVPKSLFGVFARMIELDTAP